MTVDQQLQQRTMKMSSKTKAMISVLLCLICAILTHPANAQKDDVEWLYPPGLSNDVFNQGFPQDFFGPPPPPGIPQGPPGGQGLPGINGGGGIGGGGGGPGNNPGYKPEPILSASASIIAEAGENGMSGVVTFRQYQPYAPVITYINVTGMGADKQLGVHIHWYGDIADGCNSTGPHYRQSIVGNAETKGDGNLEFEFQSPYLNLGGPNSIIGRSIVFHEKPIQYNVFPNIQPSPTDQQQDYPVQPQTEEQKVGAIVACGMITIKKLQGV